MKKPDYVSVTYIRTTPEKLWEAITNPEFARQYWGGNANVSDWKKDSQWQHVTMESKEIRVVGKVVESVAPKRLVLTWIDPQNSADESRVTFEIEPMDDMVQLNVVHGDFKPGSLMADKVTGGWPRVISSLKSFLETGKPLNIGPGSKGGCAKS